MCKNLERKKREKRREREECRKFERREEEKRREKGKGRKVRKIL